MESTLQFPCPFSQKAPWCAAQTDWPMRPAVCSSLSNVWKSLPMRLDTRESVYMPVSKRKKKKNYQTQVYTHLLELASYPGCFPDLHWLSVGLPEISRVTLTGMIYTHHITDTNSRRVRFPLHHGLAFPTCITARVWCTRRDACQDR